jgi:rhamnulokinase
MNDYYLAVDIGASSGRHIVGLIENEKIITEEIYRFNNSLTEKNGHLCWDVNYLFGEIINGLKKCKEIGKIPSYMGIDTWGVDFVLLDSDNNIIGDTVGYRDKRTYGMDNEVNKIISDEDLYHRTGIQKQIFNTIYQLMAVKQNNPEIMDKAKDLLMMPDYFNFLLTGIKTAEYTNATTTQLVSPITKNWDFELIEKLGYKKEIFKDISKPATVLGRLTPKIKAEIGYDLSVILPATHDTGSAVISVPSNSIVTTFHGFSSNLSTLSLPLITMFTFL